MPLSNESGYFNSFDPDDNYFEVRAIAGRVEQSREDNESQAILSHKIKKLADTLYRNGQLLRGSFTPSAANPNIINLEASEIYYNGVVHEVPAAQVTLTGVGSETIGVIFTETLATYLTDNNLRDPATGYPNAGQPGSNRLKITKTWAVNNPNAIPVYEFLDGQPAKILDGEGEDTVIEKTLARRTYDESGNYTVAGFDVSVEPKDTSEFYVVVGNTSSAGSSSKAYVQGREIIKLLPERHAIKKGTADWRLFELDQVIYTGIAQSITINGVNYNTANLLRVAEDRLKEFTEVFAEFRIDNQAVVHSGVGSADSFISSGESLREIYAVKNTSGGANAYNINTDYLKVGNTISWSPAGAEPAVGATYYIDYRYKRKLLTSEYNLLVDEETGFSYLDLTNCTPKPEEGYGVDVSYNFYLSRVDVVYVKPSGVIEILKGEPEKAAYAKPVPVGMLGLCEIKVNAGQGAEAAEIVRYNTTRFTMEDLHKILTRLERAEYNQAIKDLDANAQVYAGASINTLSGILTEGFRYTAEDHVQDGVGSVTRVKYDKALTSNRILDLPAQEMVLPELTSSAAMSIVDGSTTARKWSLSQTLATSTETSALISQALATSAIKVNQFGTGVRFPIIVISPVVELDSETDSVVSGDSELLAQTSLVGTRENTPAIVDDINRANNLKQYTANLKTFMKSGKLIHVRGYGYVANSHVQAYFDNTKVNLTPITSSVGLPPGITLPSANTLASVDGKVQVNANGEFLATFTIPAGVPTGTKAVTVADSDESSASASFQGRGLQKFGVTASSFAISSAPGVVPTPSSQMSTLGAGGNLVAGEPAVSTILTFNAPTNLTGASTLTFSGTFSGLAKEAVVTVNGVTERFPITQSTAGFNVTTTASYSQAVEYEFYLSAGTTKTSESRKGTITFNSLVPSGAAPGLTVAVNKAKTATAGHVTATISWKATGTANKVALELNLDSSKYRVNTTGIDLTNLALEGSASITFYADTTAVITAASSTARQISEKLIIARDGVRSRKPFIKTDTVAQTFTITEPVMITGVDVYFKTADATVPVTLQLRSAVNGVPGPQVIASKQLAASSINVSATGTTATSFTFDDPAWLTIDDNIGSREYCFVVVSESPTYELFVAKVGETTLVSPATVNSQAYLDGAAFVSSNDSSWSAILDTDLKFVIKRALFNPSADNTVILQSIATANCTGMFIGADVVNQDANNKVAWEYQLNDNSGWKIFTPGTFVDFDVVATQVDIRAKLIGTETSSPIIHSNTISCKLLFRQASGEYITKRATFQTAYNEVRMITRAFVPGQCTMKIYITDETAGAGPGNFTWTELTSWNTPITLPDGKYVEKDNNPGYTLSASPTRKFFRFRIRLETTDLAVTPRVRDVMAIVNA